MKIVHMFVAILAGILPWTLVEQALASDLVFSELQFRATVGNMPNSAAYLSVTNKSADDEFLIGVESNLARKTELHSMVMDGGVMRMRQVETGLRIPAGKTLHLAPGGYHIMLSGLRAPLAVGSGFSVSLLFEHAGKVTLHGMAKRPSDIKSRSSSGDHTLANDKKEHSN